MKKITLFILLLIMSVTTFSQQTEPFKPVTKEDFLKRSKSQKKAAFIFLGITAVCIGIAAPGDVSFDVLPVLVIGGAGAAVTSILLFSAAGRNKRKAMKMSASIDAKRIPDLTSSGIFSEYYLALSLKIDL